MIHSDIIARENIAQNLTFLISMNVRMVDSCWNRRLEYTGGLRWTGLISIMKTSVCSTRSCWEQVRKYTLLTDRSKYCAQKSIKCCCNTFQSLVSRSYRKRGFNDTEGDSFYKSVSSKCALKTSLFVIELYFRFSYMGKRVLLKNVQMT